MKKFILIIGIALLGFYVNAQDTQFGIKGGLNLANLGGDAEGDSRTSFHIGGIAEIMISDQFSLQPELLYSAQGAVSPDNDDVVTQLDYLNLPIIAKYYVVEGFSLEGGPQIGYAINRNVDNDGEDVDADDLYNAIDISLGLGASYKLDQGLFFSARYNFGISNIIQDDVQDEPMLEDIETFNNVFQLSVGYTF